MSKFLSAILLICVGLVASNIFNNNFVEVRQDKNRVGVVGLINQDTGRVVKEAPVTFTFSWPSVQMTSNTKDKKVYITAFPDNSSKSELYQYNANLEFEHSWPDTDFWFFDLQYCLSQNTLYGIKVVSTYGRVLSRFQALPTETTVNATELFAVPYMWYVNATTFDQTTNHYFGLLNYFPNRPESVVDQQLVHCDFTSGTGEHCKVIAVDNTFGIVHFLSYAMSTKHLYVSVMQEHVEEDVDTITIATLDTNTGKLTKVWDISFPSSHEDAQYLLLGPLAYSEVENALSFYLRERVSAAWQLWKLPLHHTVTVSNNNAVKVSTFENIENFHMISAAAIF